MHFNRKSFYFVASLTKRVMTEEEVDPRSMRSHQQQLTKIKAENNHFLSCNNHIKAILMAIAISNGRKIVNPIHRAFYFIICVRVYLYILVPCLHWWSFVYATVPRQFRYIYTMLCDHLEKRYSRLKHETHKIKIALALSGC